MKTIESFPEKKETQNPQICTPSPHLPFKAFVDAFFFFKRETIFSIYLFIYWLCRVLVAAGRIFHCSTRARHCGVWASL